MKRYALRLVRAAATARQCAAAAAIAAAVASAAPFASAAPATSTMQQVPNPLAVDPVTLVALYRQPGTIVAQGQVTPPAGLYGLTGYRIEELVLPVPLDVSVGGQPVRVDRAWRVSITGGPFPVRALPPVIWADDVPLGVAHEKADLTEVSVVVFDRSMLSVGATLALSYGFDPDACVELPTPLQFGGQP